MNDRRRRFGSSSLVDVVRSHAQQRPDALAYRFLRRGEVAGTLTYADLDAEARRIGAYLSQIAEPGDRHLLVYPQDLNYAAAFFGCQYAGQVAVPVYPPEIRRPRRSIQRLVGLLRDSQPATVLTSKFVLDKMRPVIDVLPGLPPVKWIATDAIGGDSDGFEPARAGLSDLSFLQYTSGSTASPRGVMLTHGNLLHNLQHVATRMGLDEDSRLVFWLPLYHDMGLIGKLLMTVFLGVEGTFMSPVDFLESPVRWLDAISRYGGTHSGGPNFGYELCTRKVTDEQLANLDLSTWRSAFNGAEPIRAATLDAFARRFASAGFRATSLAPCYGLAEATLAVSMTGDEAHQVLRVDPTALRDGAVQLTDAADATELVSCGPIIDDIDVVIVDPDTDAPVEDDRVGEILVAGGSVANAYWGKEAASRETFGTTLEARPGRRYLRTGDLGFLHDDLLYCCGRIKDVIIVRGRNHYPHDFEGAVERCTPRLRPGTSAAFGLQRGDTELLCVVVEVRKGDVSDADAIWDAARAAVADLEALPLGRLVLVAPGAVPKTSSGKIQRRATRRMLEHGELEILADLQARTRRAPGQQLELSTALANQVALKVSELAGCSVTALRRDQPFDEVGLDSIQRVELRDHIETLLGRRLPTARVAELETLADLEHLVAEFAPDLARSPTSGAELETPRAALRTEPRPGLDVVLHDFQVVQPTPARDQADLLQLTADLLGASDPTRRDRTDTAVQRFGVSPDIISKRQFTTLPAGAVGAPPTTHPNPAAHPAGLALQGRMETYRTVVDGVVDEAFAGHAAAPDEVIHVTCSGYMAPSPVETLVSRRGWRHTTVTHCYHMGCYAAFPAVRMASGSLTAAGVLQPDRPWHVEVMHSELLSAHLDLTRSAPGDIVTSTLFADGFIRYAAGRHDAVQAAGKPGLRVLAYREEILPESAPEMTWDLEAHQFHMFLSRNVPLHIGDAIDGFVDQLCADAGIRFADERDHMAYALHPGGARIVDFLRHRLGLSEPQVATSRAVLREHGNMSSATVPHIWQRLLSDPGVAPGTRVLSVAFGPGLTAAGLLLEKV